MKNVTIALLVLVMTSGNVFAFGIPSFGVKKAATSSVSLEDAMSSQDDLVSAYVAGNKFDFKTKALLAEALGLRDEAATFQTAADSIGVGNVKDIAATQAQTEGAQEAIELKMAESEGLSSESKAMVCESLVCLAASVTNYKKAAELSSGALESATSVIKGASLTNVVSLKSKLGPVLSVAPKVPGALTSIVATASKYFAFAKSAGISVPSDAGSVLGAL